MDHDPHYREPIDHHPNLYGHEDESSDEDLEMPFWQINGNHEPNELLRYMHDESDGNEFRSSSDEESHYWGEFANEFHNEKLDKDYNVKAEFRDVADFEKELLELIRLGSEQTIKKFKKVLNEFKVVHPYNEEIISKLRFFALGEKQNKHLVVLYTAKKDCIEYRSKCLMWAVQYCPSTEIVNALIKAGGKINYRDLNNNTLLHMVNSSIIARLLISKGLNVNSTNNGNQTPLHKTLQKTFENVFLVKELIQNEADVNVEDYRGFTPLAIALRNSSYSPDAVKALISGGADINTRGLKGNSLLHMIDNYPSLANELISFGLSVNLTNQEYLTPLHYILKHHYWQSEKCLEAIKILVKNGANANVGDRYPLSLETPFEWLLKYKLNPDIVEFILSAGGNIRVKDFDLLLRMVILYPTLIQRIMRLGFDVNMTNDKGQTILHIILEHISFNEEYIGVVNYLVEINANVNLKDKQGIMPMDVAIKNKVSSNVVKALISRGGSINYRDSQNNTLLHSNPELANELIPLGLDVNFTNNDGETPLHSLLKCNSLSRYRASKKDTMYLDKVQLLIQNRADVNALDNKGLTPLAWALERKASTDIVKVLISEGCDVMCRDLSGNTIIHVIYRYPTLVSDLISRDLNINSLNSINQTPLHNLLNYYYLREDETFLELFKILIRNNANLYGKDDKGITPIDLMMKCKKISDVVKALISDGKDVKCKDANGDTFLHVIQCPDVANDLISLGLDIEETNNNGQTPLHCQIARKYKDPNLLMVRFLIKNKANLNIIDNYGYTPLSWAIVNNASTDVAKALISTGVNVTYRDIGGNSLLHFYPGLVTELISFGIDVGSTNNNGETPLHYVLKSYKLKDNKKCLEAVELLINNNADVKAIDKLGYTPLIWALMRKASSDIVKVLIFAEGNLKDKEWDLCLGLVMINPTLVEDFILLGFDVNMTNEKGQSHLHYLLESKSPKENVGAIKKLIQNGANLNLLDKDGNTPMTLAFKNRVCCDIMKALVYAGGDINVRDSNGNTLLHIAEYYSLTNYIVWLGFDFNVPNNDIKTPFQTLLQHLLYNPSNSEIQMIYFFISNGCKYIFDYYYPPLTLESQVMIKYIILLHYWNNMQLKLIHFNKHIFRDSRSRYFIFGRLNNCVKEIERMKLHFVTPNLSLFNFLKLKNPKQYCNFDFVNKSNFPEYIDILEVKMLEYSRRYKLSNHFKRVFIVSSEETDKICLDNYNFSHTFQYLSNIDLLNLMKASFID